jgi:hypothetical protein
MACHQAVDDARFAFLASGQEPVLLHAFRALDLPPKRGLVERGCSLGVVREYLEVDNATDGDPPC